MPGYRRWHGPMVFLTLVAAERRPIFASPRARELLHGAMAATRAERPWEMVGIVLLPDHLHMLWGLGPDGGDYSTRVSVLKVRFTRAFLALGGKEGSVPGGQRRHRLRGVWQRRFWEHTIRDSRDFHKHLDYIHINPVKHGLAAKPKDWPWSSFHRYVEMGWYEPDWSGDCDLPGSAEYFWPE